MDPNVANHLAAVSERGYTVVPAVFSIAECTKYKNILEKSWEKYSPKHFRPAQVGQHGLDDKSNEKIVFNLHNKDLAFLDMIGHKAVLPIVKAVLQEGSYQNSEKVIYALSTARSPIASAKPQQLHIDARMPGTPFALSAIALWMLDDFTVESGATRIVPGSHRRQTYPENGVTYPDEMSVCAPAGSVLVYNGALWHGGGAKSLESCRWACIVTYSRWFLKPQFDFNQNVPRAFYEAMSDEMKDLMGYKVNPPKDEFTRISTRSETFEPPHDYRLPD